MSENSQPSRDRRRHPRFRTSLAGRYMLPDGREFACTVIDASRGGVALRAPSPGTIGDAVIVYVDRIGRLEGTITRLLDEGFALELHSTTRAAERIGRRLEELRSDAPPGQGGFDAGALSSSAGPPAGDEAPTSLALSGARLHFSGAPRLETLIELSVGPLCGRLIRQSSAIVAIEFGNGTRATSLAQWLAALVGAARRA